MIGFWLLLAIFYIMVSVASIIVLLIVKATLAGYIFTFFVLFFTLILAIFLRFVVKGAFRRREPEKHRFNISRDEVELFEDAKSYMWEQEGIVVGAIFSRGINMIRTEDGQTIAVYGIHFRDRDTNRKYLYGSLVEAASVRKYQSVDKVLDQQEINDFLNTLAKGVREVIKRRITRTDDFGRPLYTEESTEPVMSEAKKDRDETSL